MQNSTIKPDTAYRQKQNILENIYKYFKSTSLLKWQPELTIGRKFHKFQGIDGLR